MLMYARKTQCPENGNDVRVKRSVNDRIGHKCNNMRKSRSNTKYKVVNLSLIYRSHLTQYYNTFNDV